MEQRPSDRDSSIVDEAKQRFAAERRADLTRGGQDRGLIGDIEQKRGEIRAEFALEAVGVRLLAHAADYPESAHVQHICSRPPPAGRRPRNDHTLQSKIPLRSPTGPPA